MKSNKFDFIPPVKKAPAVASPGEDPGNDIEIIPPVYSDPPNIIADTNAEMQSLLDNVKSNVQKEKATKAKNTSTRFFFAVYFQDEDQKKEFLDKAKLNDITAGQYINGLEFASAMGIEIEKKILTPPGKFKGFKTD